MRSMFGVTVHRANMFGIFIKHCRPLRLLFTNSYGSSSVSTSISIVSSSNITITSSSAPCSTADY